MGSLPHLFSVDVEEHFQVSAFERYAPRETWESFPSRVVANTERLLDLMEERNALGTFFTLGWVADRQPQLIRDIVARGHELASHSYWHARVTTLTRDQFREEVRRSKQSLEDASGVAVVGYRAPSFSIVPGLEWAFDILVEEGYRYDSSLFPIRRKGYGYPGADPEPHALRTRAGMLDEFPIATTTFGSLRLPAGGGGYLRHLPFGLVRRALIQADTRGTPAMLYIHPWEVDPDQPRLPVGWITQQRHYRGLEHTFDRLRRLMTEFRFTSVARWRARSAQ